MEFIIDETPATIHDNEFDLPDNELNALRLDVREYMESNGFNLTLIYVQTRMNWGRYLTLTLISTI